MNYFLLIAYYLSILSFYLGVLIYALPIPWSGLKRWGPRLIMDSFFVASLAASFDLIIKFVDNLRITLGADWHNFFAFVGGLTIFKTTLLIALATIQSFLSKFIPGIAKVLSIIMSKISYSLYASTMMLVLGEFIRTTYWFLASLGIALMAIPFRIARGAGALLLSMALVFYVALPLYPYFLTFIVSAPEHVSDVYTMYGNVENPFNTTIGGGFVSLRVNNESIPVGIIAGDMHVELSVDPKYMKQNVSLVIDVCGHAFLTNVSNVRLESLCNTTTHTCRVNMFVYGLVRYGEGIALHVYPPPRSIHVDAFTPSFVEVTLDCDKDTCYTYLSIVEVYQLTSIELDNETIDPSNALKYAWYWYDTSGCTYEVPVPYGNHTIKFFIERTSELPPEPLELYYRVLVGPFENRPSIITIFARMFYLELVGALLYITILLSASIGLARVLGGGARLRVIP